MLNGRGNLGIQNSKQCREYIEFFYSCQKENGIWSKASGACASARDSMEKCLYEEYVQRRTENLAKSRERMQRLSDLDASKNE